MHGLDDSAALSVLIQLLKAMLKYEAEVLISLLSSLSWTLGKRGTDQRGGRLVPRRARLDLSWPSSAVSPLSLYTVLLRNSHWNLYPAANRTIIFFLGVSYCAYMSQNSCVFLVGTLASESLLSCSPSFLIYGSIVSNYLKCMDSWRWSGDYLCLHSCCSADLTPTCRSKKRAVKFMHFGQSLLLQTLLKILSLLFL